MQVFEHWKFTLYIDVLTKPLAPTLDVVLVSSYSKLSLDFDHVVGMYQHLIRVRTRVRCRRG